MTYTTIQINVNTRKRINNLKNTLRQTYDEILNSLLDLVPGGDDEGKYTDEFKASIIRGLTDIKHGRTRSVEEVKQTLGIE